MRSRGKKHDDVAGMALFKMFALAPGRMHHHLDQRQPGLFTKGFGIVTLSAMQAEATVASDEAKPVLSACLREAHAHPCQSQDAASICFLNSISP